MVVAQHHPYPHPQHRGGALPAWISPEEDSSRDGLGDASNQELWNLVMVTHRLKRWNGAQYQANLWAGVGGGLLTVIPNNGASLHNRAAWSP